MNGLVELWGPLVVLVLIVVAAVRWGRNQERARNLFAALEVSIRLGDAVDDAAEWALTEEPAPYELRRA